MLRIIADGDNWNLTGSINDFGQHFLAHNQLLEHSSMEDDKIKLVQDKKKKKTKENILSYLLFPPCARHCQGLCVFHKMIRGRGVGGAESE